MPRKAKATPLEKRTVLCIRNGGHYLIEQRPARGRWAGLWQFVTFETNGQSATAEARQRFGVKIHRARRIGKVKHALTHRRYEFEAYLCEL
jgi:adenine-specific DNA glycosylase